MNHGRVLNVRVPCLSEQTSRSVLGLTPVYNLLPFSLVDLKTVREFQAGLQDLMKQVAASNNDQWQSIFSFHILTSFLRFSVYFSFFPCTGCRPQLQSARISCHRTANCFVGSHSVQRARNKKQIKKKTNNSPWPFWLKSIGVVPTKKQISPSYQPLRLSFAPAGVTCGTCGVTFCFAVLLLSVALLAAALLSFALLSPE